MKNLKTTIITALLLLAMVSVAVAQDSSLKVSGFLVYDDGSLSTFDALNDKSVVLWNSITGNDIDGDKWSHKVKIILSGNVDKVKLSIKNGSMKPFIKENIRVAGAKAYVINNTGCEEVMVAVNAESNTIYQGSIPFHCGE